jgi:glycerophosphoryl diester phosphodiesterase
MPSKTFAMAGTLLAVSAADAAAFDVIGHRGARGLAPENTLVGFMKGAEVGATTVEADVTLTRDRQVIVRHEMRVSRDVCRGPNQRRFFKNLTLRQVRRLDCGMEAAPGAHVPELGQVYRAVPKSVRVLVEPKTNPYVPRYTFPVGTVARRVVRTIRGARAVRRTTVQSFDWRMLRAIGRIEPRLRLQGLASGITVFPGTRWAGGVGAVAQIPAAAQLAGLDAVALPRLNVTPELLADAHARRLRVVAFTIDDPAKMSALIGLGADGIVTDYPDRLSALR